MDSDAAKEFVIGDAAAWYRSPYVCAGHPTERAPRRWHANPRPYVCARSGHPGKCERARVDGHQRILGCCPRRPPPRDPRRANSAVIRPSFYTGVGARFGESSLRGFLRVVAQAVRVAVSARRAHSGPNGPLKTPAWGWRAPGLSFDRRTTPVAWVRAWMSAVCAARCQRSRGAVVLSATGRSGPEPSAWGRG